MLVILSGQYLESELASEFGAIPACFLPVGNKRLYTYQLAQYRQFYDDIFMTLPHDFPLDAADRRALQQQDVLVYRTFSGCSIGDAVRQLLSEIETEGRIDILYGDTLIREADLDGGDWLAVGQSQEFYRWHYDERKDKDQGEGPAWCGMFSFTDSAALRDVLDREPDFIRAVELYGKERGLQRRRVGEWLDFGHVHTYFTSKLSATTQRHFNRLAIDDGVLTKSSEDGRKMAAEAAWFEGAPASIRHYLPNFVRVQKDDGVKYSLEYLPLAALNELFVFGRLPAKVWSRIFDSCNRYLQAAAAVPVPHEVSASAGQYVRGTYLDKTQARLAEFARQTGASLSSGWTFNGVPAPSLASIAEHMGALAVNEPPVPSFIHGDFCFSNILFDFRAGRIKLIDPRGLDAQGGVTPFGDLRYDMAKLSHSVLGSYDLIIAGRFEMWAQEQSMEFHLIDQHTEPVRQVFREKRFVGRTASEWGCYPAMVLLFLSMLPLHVDDPRRQQALLANCLRLYLQTTS